MKKEELLRHVRRACVHHHEEMCAVLLTPSERFALGTVMSGCEGSSDIANNTGISVQYASVLLLKLYEKGYLTRKQVTSDSGGYEYTYKEAIL